MARSDRANLVATASKDGKVRLWTAAPCDAQDDQQERDVLFIPPFSSVGFRGEHGSHAFVGEPPDAEPESHAFGNEPPADEPESHDL